MALQYYSYPFTIIQENCAVLNLCGKHCNSYKKTQCFNTIKRTYKYQDRFYVRSNQLQKAHTWIN